MSIVRTGFDKTVHRHEYYDKDYLLYHDSNSDEDFDEDGVNDVQHVFMTNEMINEEADDNREGLLFMPNKKHKV